MRLSRVIIGVLTGVTAWGLGLGSVFAETTTVTAEHKPAVWPIAQRNAITLKSLEDANPYVMPLPLELGVQVQQPNDSPAYDTPGNLYWLERVIYAEAGGESLQTQIAVGDVIMHRVKSGQYGGNNVHDVVFQHANGVYQFSSVANGHIYSRPSSSSIQAAKDVLEDGHKEVRGALVFYNPAHTSKDNWVRSQPTVKHIGHLVFAK